MFERTDVARIVGVCGSFFCGFEFFGHAGYVSFCIKEGTFVFFEIVFQSCLFDFEFDVLQCQDEKRELRGCTSLRTAWMCSGASFPRRSCMKNILSLSEKFSFLISSMTYD